MSMTSLFSNLNVLMQDDDHVDDLMIVDTSNIAVATLMANFVPKTQNDINIDIVRHLICDTIRQNVMRFKSEYPDIVLALDSNKYWRKTVAPYYKKKRKEEHEKSEWDWDRLNSFLNPVYGEVREFLPYKALQVDYAEGDDVIGVLTKKAVAEGRRVLVVSADGDGVQLQKYSGVMQWSPTQKKWVKPKYGTPQNDLRMKIIKGDKKDSIASIKSRSDYVATRVEGERAPSIMQKELDVWLDAVDPTLDMTPEMAARYKENERLRDFDFIPKDVANSILEAYNAPKLGNKSKMHKYFVSNRMVRMVEKISDF